MEENEENRNCMCDNENECKYIPQGINAAFGYNTASNLMDDMNCCNSKNEMECMQNRNRVREKMMKEIKCLNFAIVDLAEYLDTHPNDQKALCLHREYANRLKNVKDKYQRIFGPLDIYFPCNKWRWLEEPWPWERSDFNVDL
jgi:spore coat protein JB